MLGSEASSVIGEKSFSGSYGSLLYRLALMACELIVPPQTVYPSAGARAHSAAPMDPAWPGLFSTTTGCPRELERPAATILPRMSVVPPGAKLTMYRIGLFGQACARATAGSRANVSSRVFRFFIGLLLAPRIAERRAGSSPRRRWDGVASD